MQVQRRKNSRGLMISDLFSLASRLVYNYVYVIAQDNARMAYVRSLTWAVGFGIILTLFVKAGNAVSLRG